MLAAGCSGTSSGSGCPGRCTSFGYEACLGDDVYAEPVPCDDDEICIPELGCATCVPDSPFCVGDEVWTCNEDGTGGDFDHACEDDLVCSDGQCKTPCERADDLPSNVGCHFWSADLDNESVEMDLLGPVGSNDAAAQQFAVAIANNNDRPVTARVYRNNARVGQPIDESLVLERQIQPHSLEQLDLPAREVDGTMGQNGSYNRDNPAHTFVSPHAYRIETSDPVVAYQFNPIIQQFSNDASILIPRQALGRHYFVLGWPTSNPCGGAEGTMFHQDSIPDRTSITIVGTEDNTMVTVIPTHPIVGSSGDSGITIPPTAAGETLTFTINTYDVVNLESDQPMVDNILDCASMLDRTGDFTGTQVSSSRNVAVFSSNERGSGTGGADIETYPGWDSEDTCCTDHLEQQMFPTAALGREFAVSRSPIRSTMAGYTEPDLYRILATENGTNVFTNLPAPDDRFTLQQGEHVTFSSATGFSLSADKAIMFGQYLLSQGYVPGGIGDPTFVVFPAAEQHRKSYVFLVPTTFEDNFMVLAMQVGATIAVDGGALGEFSGCERAPIGTIVGIDYEQVTCPMNEGVHTVSSDEPFGLTVYGYYNVGSYGYPGGSDVKIINPVE
jgi:hypothetical protein